jgi:uncharacterized membrane protein
MTELTESKINLGRAERWLSSLGGAALIRSGLRRRSLGGVLMAAGGAALVYRGATGTCAMYRRLGLDTATLEESRQIEIREAITVARPVNEVYSFWRQLENLPQTARHLESVMAREDGSSRWVAREGMLRLIWDAQSVEDAEDRRISWRSLPGSRMYTEGEVQMTEAPGDRGTEVHVRFRFTPPGGIAGLIMTPLLRPIARIQLRQELHRFKQKLETGEVATNAMRPDRVERMRPESQMGGQMGGQTRQTRQTRQTGGQMGGEGRRISGEPGGEWSREHDRDLATPADVGQVRPTPATLGAEMPGAPATDVHANVQTSKEVR